jgi:hypothetical protein
LKTLWVVADSSFLYNCGITNALKMSFGAN